MAYHVDDPRLMDRLGSMLAKLGEFFVEHRIRRIDVHYYLVRSLDDMVTLMSQIGHEDYLAVYKEPQLPVRGRPVDVSFVDSVRREYARMSNGDYSFCSLVWYPNRLEPSGSGSTIAELEEDLAENQVDCEFETLCFGRDPRPLGRSYQVDEDEEVVVIMRGAGS